MGFENRGVIAVKNLEIRVKKGLYPEEELLENRFVISSEVVYNTEDMRGLSYLNYETLAMIIHTEMHSDTRLLEKSAETILNAIFKEWPMAVSAFVCIEKSNPSFSGLKMDAVTVTLERHIN